MSNVFNPYPYTDAFARAEAFLAKGRNKHERPLKSNTRLRRIDDDAIAVVFHYTAVVTYHRDGTFTIFGGGWNSPTTKNRISEFSPSRPGSDGKGNWTVGVTGEITAPRVQKCRSCKGVPTWMAEVSCHGPNRWGPSYCPGGKQKHRLAFGGKVTFDEYFQSRYDEPCPHGKMNSHSTEPCEHDQWDRHVLGTTEQSCHRCAGTGKADYGSKQVPILVTCNDPYRVDATGAFLDATYQPTTHSDMPSVPPRRSKYEMGAAVADQLVAVVPGLDALVKHPLTSQADSVRRIIVSLNDQHHWTREAVADWLDTLDVDLRFPAVP